MKINKTFLIAFLIIIIDQISKFLIRNNIDLNSSISIINNVFHLTYISNTGSVFGLLKNVAFINIILIVVSFIVIGVLTYYILKLKDEKSLPIALGLILGGTIGNLIDRIFFGHVIDFLDFRIWPIFNVADSAITISIIFLVFYFWKK